MSINRRRLVELGWALVGIGVTPVLRGRASGEEPQAGGDRKTAQPDPAADPKWLEEAWTRLERDDPEASQALLRFADRPADAVAFFRSKMKPLVLTTERLNGLLEKLGSPEEDVWKPAFEELEYFDPRLAAELPVLMNDVIDSPVRQRMVAVMSDRPAAMVEGKDVILRPVGRGYNFSSTPGGSWWAEPDVALLRPKKKWTRAVRAIVLLEHIATPDAVALLKDMAAGHPLAQPTRVAAEALERLGNK
jgi:hypothetical protein